MARGGAGLDSGCFAYAMNACLLSREEFREYLRGERELPK